MQEMPDIIQNPNPVPPANMVSNKQNWLSAVVKFARKMDGMKVPFHFTKYIIPEKRVDEKIMFCFNYQGFRI
jgi:hypothetical protein